MKTIFPGDDPTTLLAQRDAPLNPILNTPDSIFDDKMAVVNASLRGLERGAALPLLLDLAAQTGLLTRQLGHQPGRTPQLEPRRHRAPPVLLVGRRAAFGRGRVFKKPRHGWRVARGPYHVSCPVNTSGPRVLLCESRTLVRQGLRCLLEQASFRVVAEAADGYECLARACQARPDVVVADPRSCDGAALSELLNLYPATKIVMLTGGDGESCGAERRALRPRLRRHERRRRHAQRRHQADMR